MSGCIWVIKTILILEINERKGVSLFYEKVWPTPKKKKKKKNGDALGVLSFPQIHYRLFQRNNNRLAYFREMLVLRNPSTGYSREIPILRNARVELNKIVSSCVCVCVVGVVGSYRPTKKKKKKNDIGSAAVKHIKQCYHISNGKLCSFRNNAKLLKTMLNLAQHC